MVKRFSLVAVTVTAGERRTILDDPGVSGVCFHDFPARNRMIVKLNLPDGTPQDNQTIADVTLELDEDGRHRQVEVNPQPLSAAARQAIRTRLENAGFDVSRLDDAAIANRKLLLRAILRWLANRLDADDERALLDGWDVV